MKRVISIFFLVSFIMACNANKESKISEGIKFENDTLTFATVAKGDTVNLEYHFTALSDNVRVVDIVPGCGCTKPVFDSLKYYNNGERGVIHIQYLSREDLGNIVKNIVVKTNASPRLQILYFMGKVKE